MPSNTAMMLLCLLLVLINVGISQAVLQTSFAYYGTAEELSMISASDRMKPYFLRPDGYVPNCTDYACMQTMMHTSGFTCGPNLVSHVREHVHLRPGIKLLPSCVERQTISRISGPTEDMEMADVLSSGLAAVDAGYMPCTVVVLDSKDVSIQNVDIDNSGCILKASERFSTLPSYLSAAIVLLSSSSEIRNIKIHDVQSVKSANSMLAYIGMNSDAEGMLANVSLTMLHNNSIFIDMLSGDVVLDDSVNVKSFLLHGSRIPSTLHVDRFIGPIASVKLLSRANLNETKYVAYKTLFIVSSIAIAVLLVYIVTSLIHVPEAIPMTGSSV